MNTHDDLPEFPLTITSHRDGDAWTFESAEDLENAIDAFNADAEAASVIDGRGRLVRLVVENRRIVVLQLVPGWPPLQP